MEDKSNKPDGLMESPVAVLSVINGVICGMQLAIKIADKEMQKLLVRGPDFASGGIAVRHALNRSLASLNASYDELRKKPSP